MLRKRVLWTRVARWSEGLREAHADLEQGLAGKKHEHDEQIVERLATAFNNATTDFDKRTFLQFAADLPEAGIGGTSVLSVWILKACRLKALAFLQPCLWGLRCDLLRLQRKGARKRGQ